MSYERILVAIDISDEAEQVIATAKAQAIAQGNPELHLVSVVKPVTARLAGIEPSISSTTATLENDLRRYTEDVLKKWAEELGLPATSQHIVTGSPAAEIRLVAEKIGADLIIIGTHGRHGLGLLLGSTANGVLHGTQCDVLTVRIS